MSSLFFGFCDLTRYKIPISTFFGFFFDGLEIGCIPLWAWDRGCFLARVILRRFGGRFFLGLTCIGFVSHIANVKRGMFDERARASHKKSKSPPHHESPTADALLS